MSLSPFLNAAIDLGSNSFRLTLAQIDKEMTAQNNHIKPIHSIHETVRLAAGLNAHKLLTQSAISRGLKTLHRFKRYLNETQPQRIHIVATSALRQALNAQEFLKPAQQILNCPIHVISGQEEASLIYSGSLYRKPPDQQRRLVIDIGGGSTELIIGHHEIPELTASLNIGCIAHTYHFFHAGHINATAMQQAETYVQKIITPVLASYRQLGWTTVFASSGTASALAKVLATYHLNRHHSLVLNTTSAHITRTGLTKLKALVLNAKHIDQLALEGLDTDRIPVFLGGLTIMLGLMTILDIEIIETIGDVLPLGIFKQLQYLNSTHLPLAMQHNLRVAP